MRNKHQNLCGTYLGWRLYVTKTWAQYVTYISTVEGTSLFVCLFWFCFCLFFLFKKNKTKKIIQYCFNQWQINKHKSKLTLSHQFWSCHTQNQNLHQNPTSGVLFVSWDLFPHTQDHSHVCLLTWKQCCILTSICTSARGIFLSVMSLNLNS